MQYFQPKAFLLQLFLMRLFMLHLILAGAKLENFKACLILSITRISLKNHYRSRFHRTRIDFEPNLQKFIAIFCVIYQGKKKKVGELYVDSLDQACTVPTTLTTQVNCRLWQSLANPDDSISAKTAEII